MCDVPTRSISPALSAPAPSATSGTCDLVALFACVLATVGAATAFAEATATICVPEASSKSVLSTNTKGECPTKSTTTYKAVTLPGTAELETLNRILPDISYKEAGVGGKPTVEFTGVNVQIVSGSGSTAGTVNGEGNLIIGYDEGTGTQTGSHNLVLGGRQEYTSFGGLLADYDNSLTAPFASISGGRENSVTREEGSISGGIENKVKATGASVSGGSGNTAEGNNTTVSGGADNRAEATGSSISGGIGNYTAQPGNWASILGGHAQTLNTEYGLYP